VNTCHEFLQHVLPKLGYRWAGFRKVRRQVCRRIHQRMQEIETNNFRNYLNYLEKNAQEWDTLDRMLDITITRFYRDRGVFEIVEKTVLPDLIVRARHERRRQLQCWSAGCCNGEEVYSLQLLWHERLAPDDIHLTITATDRNETVLERARTGRFPEDAFKDLPRDLLENGFDREDSCYVIKSKYKHEVKFLRQDIRNTMPDGPFDIIFCRNLVLTYFDTPVRNIVMTDILSRLRQGGYLIIGANEHLPETIKDLRQLKKGEPVYQLRTDS